MEQRETTPVDTGLTQGSYFVTVNDGGCTTSEIVNVGETPGAILLISQHIRKFCTIMDGPVTFTDNSVGTIVNWQWNFGDNSSYGSGTNTTHPIWEFRNVSSHFNYYR